MPIPQFTEILAGTPLNTPNSTLGTTSTKYNSATTTYNSSTTIYGGLAGSVGMDYRPIMAEVVVS